MAIKIAGVTVIDDNENLDISGNATIDGYVALSSTERMKFPAGTTAQRPGSPVQGDARYNLSQNALEVYNAGWFVFYRNTHELLERASPRSGSTIDITGFSTAYDTFILEAYNLKSSLGSDTMRIQFSDDGGSTFKNGATDYIWTVLSHGSTLTGSTHTNDSSDSSIGVHASTFSSSSLGAGMSFSLKCVAFNTTTAASRPAIGGTGFYYGGGASQQSAFSMSGLLQSTDVNINALRIFLTGSTFTDGEIYLYGVRS